MYVGRSKVSAARQMRLRRPEEFRACYQRGRMFKSSVAVLHVLPNGESITRVGFSVSKRLGKAVQRNLVRRRLRAIIEGYQLAPGYDVVIAARVRSKDLPFSELNTGVRALLRRAKLLVDSPDSRGR